MDPDHRLFTSTASRSTVFRIPHGIASLELDVSDRMAYKLCREEVFLTLMPTSRRIQFDESKAVVKGRKDTDRTIIPTFAKDKPDLSGS